MTTSSYRGAMLLCAAACGSAYAAETEADRPAPSAELAPVIVTAQRRSENLQTVPIAVTSP
jgi:iron complex outermembrane receptor protein